MNKYPFYVYRYINEYLEENGYEELTNEQIDKMPVELVLDYYLTWNGIVGYTNDILAIFKANK